MGKCLRKVVASMAVLLLLGGLAVIGTVAVPQVAAASGSTGPIKIGLICACVRDSWGPTHLTFHPLPRRGPTR